MWLMTAHALRNIFEIMRHVPVRIDLLPLFRDEPGGCRDEFLKGSVAFQTSHRSLLNLCRDGRRLGLGRLGWSRCKN